MNEEKIRAEAVESNSVNERSVDSMVESVISLLREIHNSVSGLIRNLLAASLIFTACGDPDLELLLSSEQLTDMEHDKIQTEIDQIRLSIKVFSFMAPKLNPLFNAHGEALDDDANHSVVMAMEDAVVKLQSFLDEERILKIREENLPKIGLNSIIDGFAFGSQTHDPKDDYISVVTRPTQGVGRVGLENAAGILMHESAHFPFGSLHSERVNEAVDGGEDWIAIAAIDMEDRDFPYLISFIMESGIGSILKVPVPFQQQISTLLGQGYELDRAVNFVYVKLLRQVRPFDQT